MRHPAVAVRPAWGPVVSARDAVEAIASVVCVLDAFPLWGPLVAVVTALLLVHAYRTSTAEDTGGDSREDGPPPVLATVPLRGDTSEDTGMSAPVTCEDTCPRPFSGPGTTGGDSR